MAQTIKLKRSSTSGASPTTSQLALGEVAINTYDGKMYIKKDDGTESIVEIGAVEDYTLPVATSTVLGGIELFSNTDQTVAANTVTATSGRTYGIQLNSDNQAVVNVPWSDTNTTYSAGTGITLTGTEFSLTDTNDKLNLSGGTITSGTNTGLVIDHDTFARGLELHRNHGTHAPSIVFSNNGGRAGVLYATQSDGHLRWRPTTTTESNEVWHAGNLTNNQSNWNTAYGWGDHSTEGYLTSFDITTQTDSKYLRSDAADTATGALTFTGNINQTGGTFISNGFATTDLNNAWQIAGTSKPQGIAPFRYQNSASNKPESGDNAHWGLNIYAHAGSSGNYPYGHQLSAASSGNIWQRWVSNGSFGTWKKIWDSGNDGSGSGLDADLLDGQHGSYYYSAGNPPPSYSLPLATNTTRGGIELFSNTDQTTAANAVTTTSGRTYGIQLNSDNQAVVNVPWTDTNTDTNTTYSFKAQQTDGNNTDPNLFLDASSGTDDSIKLVGSGATTVTRDNDGQITISSTDTNTDTDTNYYLDGITKSGNTLTFSVNGTTNQTYTFGSNAFNSTSYLPLTGGTITGNLAVSGTISANGGLTFDGIEPTVLYDFDNSGTANSLDAADYLQLAEGLATGVDISATPVITTNWSATSGTVYSDNKFRILSAKGNSSDALNANAGNSIEGLGDTTIIGNVEVDGTDTKLTAGIGIGGEKVNVIGDASFTNEIAANGGIALGDNDKATFGTSDDLQVYHDGSNSFVTDEGTGSLYLRGSSQVRVETPTGENMAIFNDNGGVSLRYNNAKKFETTSTGIDVTGTVTSDGFSLGDSQKATFGASGDLEIYHNGSHSIIEDVGNGSLFLKGDTQLKLMNGSENAVLCQKNAGVSLYYDNNQKLSTLSGGVYIFGDLTLSGTVDGKDVSTLTRIKRTEFDLTPNSTVANINTSEDSNVYKYVFVISDLGYSNGPNNPVVYAKRSGVSAQWYGGWTKAQGSDNHFNNITDIFTGLSTYQSPRPGFIIEIFKTNNRWVMRTMASIGSSGFYIVQGYANNIARDFISNIQLSTGSGYTWSSVEGYLLEYVE
jgi:hypothetical protein